MQKRLKALTDKLRLKQNIKKNTYKIFHNQENMFSSEVKVYKNKSHWDITIYHNDHSIKITR